MSHMEGTASNRLGLEDSTVLLGKLPVVDCLITDERPSALAVRNKQTEGSTCRCDPSTPLHSTPPSQFGFGISFSPSSSVSLSNYCPPLRMSHSF